MCVGRVVESAGVWGRVVSVVESAGLCVWKGGDECRVC